MMVELDDDERIMIEELVNVQFLSSRADSRVCVLQLTSNCGDRFYEMTRDQVTALGQWIMTSGMKAEGPVGTA
jgi:hypothetical protein